MKLSLARRIPAALALMAMLTQATGAADLALVSGAAARPGMMPPPAALALRAPLPRPAAARPAPKAETHFWKDAAIVARWLYAQYEGKPEPRVAPLLRRRAFHVESVGPVAEAAPRRDRVMIVKDPMIVDVAEAVRGLMVPDGEAKVYKPRIEGRWLSAGDLRYRIVYLDSYGLTWGDAQGLHFFMPNYRRVDIKADVPEEFWGEYPVYFHGQSARYDIEVVNGGAAAVERISIASRQEDYNAKGAGRASDEELVKTIRALKPGQKTVLHGQFYVGGSGGARVNLEQTHVRIQAAGKFLADEAHAGLVDPPNLAGL